MKQQGEDIAKKAGKMSKISLYVQVVTQATMHHD